VRYVVLDLHQSLPPRNSIVQRLKALMRESQQPAVLARSLRIQISWVKTTGLGQLSALVIDVDADGSKQYQTLDHLLIVDADAKDRHAVVHRAGQVVFIDIDVAASEQLLASLPANAGVHFEHADLRDIGALRRAVAGVREAFGPITILVNNASRDDRHAIEDVTPEFWDERIAST
jgi:NAD(P)-dependent dehydrogenase (short-subunit alcohol dehydrogenase family)